MSKPGISIFRLNDWRSPIYVTRESFSPEDAVTTFLFKHYEITSPRVQLENCDVPRSDVISLLIDR